MKKFVQHGCSLLHDFLFKPVSAAPISCFRIAFGLLLLSIYLLLSPDLCALFGPRGLISAPHAQLYQSLPHFSILFFLPQTDASVYLVFAFAVAAAVCLMLGLWTRPAAALSFLCLLSLQQRDPLIWHAGDTFLRITALLLIFTPCGQRFSIDSWVKRRHTGVASERLYEPWAQRLMQIELINFYATALMCKLPGQEWMDGTAVYYSTHIIDLQRFTVPYLLDHLWTVQLLTYGTLLFEASTVALLWVKPLRYWVMVAGVMFHLGIDWTMNVPVFEYVMIASYIYFIDPRDAGRLLARFKAALIRAGGPPVVEIPAVKALVVCCRKLP